MIRRVIVIGLFLVFMLCAVIYAQEDGVLLQYNFKKGDVSKYRVQCTTEFGTSADIGNKPRVFKVSFDLTEKVLEVMEDGFAKIEITSSNFKPTDEIGALLIKNGIYLVSRTGLMKEFKDSSKTSGNESMIHGFILFSMLPDKAIEVGRSWEYTVPFEDLKGDIKITSTLLDTESKVDDESCLKLKHFFDANIDFSKLLGIEKDTSDEPEELNELVEKDTKEAPTDIFSSMNFSGWTVCYLSRKDSKLVKSNSVLTIKMDMNIPEEDGSISSGSLISKTSYDITRVD